MERLKVSERKMMELGMLLQQQETDLKWLEM
jgi:hypothetical protein